MAAWLIMTTVPPLRLHRCPPSHLVDAAGFARYNAVASFPLKTCIIIGPLWEEYCVTEEGASRGEFLGGGAAYAACGARIWSPAVSVVSLLGANFRRDLIDQLAASRIDVTRIRLLDEPLEHRFFYACPSPGEKTTHNPPSHYLRQGLPLPKGLVDLSSPVHREEPRGGAMPLGSMLASLAGALGTDSAVHFCPADFQRSVALSSHVRDLGTSIVTLDPDSSFMKPGNLRELPAVIKGLSAFLPSLEEIRELFSQFTAGEWEMAEALSDMGCETVVIKCGAQGQRLWDSLRKQRWIVPAYPARVRDIHGAGDAYCGGFLAGLAQTGDALEAALRGSVSASMTVEGTGALYSMDFLPGLSESRLDFLRQMVKAA